MRPVVQRHVAVAVHPPRHHVARQVRQHRRWSQSPPLPRRAVRPPRVPQPRERLPPAAPADARVLLALDAVHLPQPPLQLRGAGARARLGPPLGRPLRPLHHAVVLRPSRRVPVHADPQPDQPQRQVGGEVAGGAPRHAVVHPDRSGRPQRPNARRSWRPDVRRAGPGNQLPGGKSAVHRTAPLHSSTTRSQQTAGPRRRRTPRRLALGCLRPRSCLFLLAFLSFAWGLGQFGLFRALFGGLGGQVQVVLMVLAGFALRYAEEYEDPSWVPFTIRYYVRRRRSVIFTGGAPCAAEPHTLRDAFVFQRATAVRP